MPTRKRTSARKSVERKPISKSQKVTMSVSSVKSTGTSTSSQSYTKNPRLWVGVGVVIIVILLFIFKGLFIAAMVNGQPISRLSVISSLEKQNGKQALDNLVVESLIMQEANRRHVTVTSADLNAQIQTLETQLKGQGVTLDSALAARGMTRSDLTDQLKIQGLLNKMLGSSITITDKQISDYISQNQDSLPKNLSDDQLKMQVKQQLMQQALQTKTQSFIADLQKKASITYFVNY